MEKLFNWLNSEPKDRKDLILQNITVAALVLVPIFVGSSIAV